MDEAELAFVATMRDEATRVARSARRAIEQVTGRTKPLEIPLRAVDYATGVLGRVEAAMGATSRRAKDLAADIRRISDKTVGTGQTLTRNVTLPLLGLAGASVALEADYGKTMRQVAIATGEPIAPLDKLAKKLGAETAFSARDAGDAMLELAKGGMSAATIQGGALEATMTLASAGGVELGDSATYVSNSLATFGLEAKDAGDVAVALAGGANASSASVQSLGDGLAQTALGAKNAGLSLNETVGALSLFDAQGLKGSDAGTSFKTMLANLVPQTAKAGKEMKRLGLNFVDAEGNFVSLDNIADQLKDTLGKKSEAERVAALSTLFGSDATRAATILTEQGAKGLAKYVAATEDVKTTTDLAGAAMQGTSGAIEKAKGSAETAALALGEALAPSVIELSGRVEELANWFTDLDPKTQKLVATVLALAAALGPALIVLGSIGRGAAGVVQGVSLMTGAVSRSSGAIKTWITDLRTAETRGAALGRAGKVAAGAAGIGALIASTQTSSDGLGGLLSVAGATATGFAFGGPLGGALAGTAGLLQVMKSRTDQSAQALADAKPKALDYASTLDQLSGAVTRQTRTMVAQQLQADGVVASGTQLGISQRDLVSAILGNEGASKRVTTQLSAQEQRLVTLGEQGKLTDEIFTKYGESIESVRGVVGGMTDELSASQRETRAAGAGVTTWGEALRGLPKSARVEIKQIGATDSIKKLRALRAEHNLTPKELRIAIRALNGAASEKEIRKIARAVMETSKTKGGVPEFAKGVERDTAKGAAAAGKGAKRTKRELETPLLSTKASLDQWVTSITTSNAPAVTAGATGGREVGAALKSGVIQGFGGTASALAFQAAAAVRAAIQAGKNAGKIKSPSRETDYIGRMLGDGLLGGWARSTKNAPANVAKVVRGMLAGLDPIAGESKMIATFDTIGERAEKLYRDQYRSAARAKLAKLNAREDKALKRADGPKERGRIRDRFERDRKKIEREVDSADDRAVKSAHELAKAYAGQRRELIANGKALDAQRQKLVDAKAQGVAFADTLKSYGALGQTQTVNDAPVTAGFIQQDLQKRLDAITAFRRNLQTLRNRGLSETYVDQIEAAGVEAGGATAAALASSTKEQLANVQRLQNQIAAQSNAAGVESVRGVVKGIESQIALLEKAGVRMANALAKAIRKALKIKSPSRLTRADGRQVPAGMALGVLDGVGEAQRAAQELARAVAGAATPAIPTIPLSYAPSVGQLARMADQTARQSVAVRSTQVVTIRHEIVSPDGSVDELTAEQIADVIVRDPKSLRRVEAALKPIRRRAGDRMISASDSA